MLGGWPLLDLVELAFRELALFAAFGFLLGALDNLTIDMLWIRRMIRRALGRPDATRRVLTDLPPPAAPGRHAIFIPAWDEADVIRAMLESTVWRFAGQDYTLFVGCYPNDLETMTEIETVAHRAANIRMAICSDPGPTTKADCLNRLWRAMRDEEDRADLRFKSIVLHDAEDVVHPSEIALFDRLIEHHDLVQIPVVPLPHPRSRWVAGHYCDEFAEAHGKDLVIRDSLGAGVPSAGVGCAIARSTLGTLAEERDGAPFDAGSLTEDYELGLSLAERGRNGTFMRCHDAASGELIAVQAHFPATLGEAVRQKTRWIAGIALYGWERLGWHSGGADLWMRIRDRSTILAALVLLTAYLAAILAFGLLIAASTTNYSLPAIPPILAIALSINFALLLWRLAMRALFTGFTYGWREALLAVPRTVISNIIAIIAARRAMTHYILARRDHPPAWDKTRHIFPETATPE
ncbi:MAG: glycosyl transferase family protein [Pseudomonadota bacterium]